MDSKILNPKIQQFIDSNIGSDISKLALSKNPFPDVDWIEILNQVSAKTKAKEKLPTWFGTENIIYPGKISVEQTSSEITAKYKSQLVSCERLIDLTGGFGVDDYYFSKQVQQVVHCEINSALSGIARHNFKALGITNVACETGDSFEIMEKSNRKFDWIYVDPSRRDDIKGKVFLLRDCLPDVPANLGFYFNFANRILIKTAPLLDLSAGLGELSNVKTIHVVAVKNEVKELLWTLEKGFSGTTKIHTINFGANEEVFEFMMDSEAVADFGLPKKYLYEPNAAIMKSGGFEEVAQQFHLEKLHKHSHLYTSAEKIDFPGRVFEIDENLAYSKNVAALHQIKKANITTRNFPDSVETIRKKWKITDGGNVFCFFTTDKNNHKIVLICTKIEPR